MAAKRTPVHVLTGFLGSGKTTLLSSLLRQPEMRDTLVIVNEVGEVSFDHLLLTEAREEVVVQLEGGCACCVVRADLLRTLANAPQAFRDAGGRRFSRVFIETSGLATPDAIVQTLMLEKSLTEPYSLGRIVATVDVVHGASTLAAYAEARAQVAAAETVVLTKLDLCDQRQRDEARARVSAFNPGADVCSSEAFLEHASTWLNEGKALETGPDPDRTHGIHREPAPFSHTGNIQTFTLRCPVPLNRRAFNEWMSVRLRFLEGQVLRVKGVVQLADSALPVFVHGVQQLFHPPRTLAEWPTPERGTHLVFVTEGIPRETIERSFNEYLAKDRPGALGVTPDAGVSRH